MTTIPGHNQILQQSSIAQEIVKGSTVQGSEESERLKKEKEKEKRAQKQTADRKKKKINQDKEMALDPDATGRLLDTTV